MSPLLASLLALPRGEMAILDLRPLKAGAEATLPARRRAWDALQAASALQGIVNRRSPRLYVLLVGDDARLDRFWLDRLSATWAKGWARPRLDSLDAAVARFRTSVRGAVVWDERVPATANVASTIAGVEDLVPVRYDAAPDSLYFRLTQDPKGPRLPVRRRLLAADGGPMFTGRGKIPGSALASSGSAKCDAYLWAAERYLRKGLCEPGLLGYYPDAYWLGKPQGIPLDRTLLENHDYVVSKRGFVFDLGPWDDEAPDDDPNQPPGTDGRTLRAILRRAYALRGGGITHVAGFTPWDQKYTRFTGRKHGEVETEWRYAEALSSFNAFMDADAAGLHAMANASVYAHEPLRRRYPQRNLPTEATLRARGYLRADGTVAPRAYATVYVGDYDSAAWLYATLPDHWNDPARGTIPLGWAFNPTLEARFPTGLVYARETATPMDFFVAGDSGAGYLNPGGLVAPRKWSGLPSGVAAWEAFSRPLLRRWDLGITGFVIDGFSPKMDDAVRGAYARLTPQGVVEQQTPTRPLESGTPFLQMVSDLPGDDVERAAGIVVDRAPRGGLSFSVFRTILWSPTSHRRLFERVRARRADVEFVDPYTLMLLAKRSLGR